MATIVKKYVKVRTPFFERLIYPLLKREEKDQRRGYVYRRFGIKKKRACGFITSDHQCRIGSSKNG